MPLCMQICVCACAIKAKIHKCIYSRYLCSKVDFIYSNKSIFIEVKKIFDFTIFLLWQYDDSIRIYYVQTQVQKHYLAMTYLRLLNQLKTSSPYHEDYSIFLILNSFRIFPIRVSFHLAQYKHHITLNNFSNIYFHYGSST